MNNILSCSLSAIMLAILMTACSIPPDSTSANSEQPLLEVFLVRHAEKTSDHHDPGLTDAGHARSAELANELRSTNLQYIHSSDFTRTTQTAAPTATDHGLEILLYDPRDLPDMANKLKAMGGRHLVVGHSNTTPQLTELLGGDPVSEINEQSEYDRLYVVSMYEDGSVNSRLLRYGKVYVPTADHSNE